MSNKELETDKWLCSLNHDIPEDMLVMVATYMGSVWNYQYVYMDKVGDLITEKDNKCCWDCSDIDYFMILSEPNSECKSCEKRVESEN